MKRLKEFLVNFGNLKPGLHRYDFEVIDEFFEHFEYSIVRHGKVDVILLIEKQSETLLLLNFHIEGYIRLQCDVCLDEYDYPLDNDERLVLKLEVAPEVVDNDEIVSLPEEAYEIDVSSFIYEYITIALPLKSACELGGKSCNPEMLNVLKKVNDANGENKDIDPRWAGLKNLKTDE